MHYELCPKTAEGKSKNCDVELPKIETKISVSEVLVSTDMRYVHICNTLLDGIALGHAISDYNDQKITLSKLLFSLNKAKFRKWDLQKLPKLITLSN
jgi:hypothetical protein